MNLKTPFATQSHKQVSCTFPPISKFGLREARVMSACARSNFMGQGSEISMAKGKLNPKSALGALTPAISSWLKIERQTRNPSMRLEAWHVLGDLYYLRGLACKKSRELSGNEASPGLLFLRMGEAFESAIFYWQKCLRAAKADGGRAEAPLKNNIVFACDEAAFAYQRASIQLIMENAFPGRLVEQRALHRRYMDIEVYEKKVDVLLDKSVRLFMSFHWNAAGSLKFSREYGRMEKSERVFLGLFEKYADAPSSLIAGNPPSE